MNPDKLFDYLEGRLPGAERAALEQRLISDKQLQRELAVARQIHSGMRGDSREVLLPPTQDVTEQGRKTALRVGAAFIVLMAVNVGIGLWLIARHETKNPNRALLESQMREQIAKSLEQAAATFTPAPLGVSEIMVPAATGKLEAVADEVVRIASRLGGSATKGLPDQGRLSVLVDLPLNRELEFRAATSSISGATETAASPAITGASGSSPLPRLRRTRQLRPQQRRRAFLSKSSKRKQSTIDRKRPTKANEIYPVRYNRRAEYCYVYVLRSQADHHFYAGLMRDLLAAASGAQ